MYQSEKQWINKLSWIFIGRTDTEAETPILWPPDAKNWLIWKDPDGGKNEGGRRRGWQRIRLLDGITDSMDTNSGSWWWTGRPGVLQSMGSQRVRHNWATELNWTEINCDVYYIMDWKWTWKSLSRVQLFATPWNSPGQNTGVGRLFLLQGIFTTQGSNPGLPHWRQILYQLSHKGSHNGLLYSN